MLFEQRFATAIADGSVTLTFRRWKRSQAVAGHRYRTSVGIIDVEAVDVVEPSDITDAEARNAGYPSARDLVADLRGTTDLPTYRIRFHHVDEPDPRDELAAAADLSPADVAEIDRRLERLDRTSAHGPWTAAVLEIIASRPGVPAADLAASLGRDRPSFKTDVRRLKSLGLTISLNPGYRLSPRGQAYRSRKG